MTRLALLAKSAAFLSAAACAWLTGCRSVNAGSGPSIEFTRVPQMGDGSPDQLDGIEGRVHGARPGERVVLFALSGVWWVQPLASQPFAEIQPDATWKSSTHPGSAYAALLVDSRYHPPLTVTALPEKGGSVLAVATAKGAPPDVPPATLQFSGYQWEVRRTAIGRDGSRNLYGPANVTTDKNGFLHLRISREQDHWVNSDIKLLRSLGYGSYRFVVRDISHLEPAAVFAMLTWDDQGPAREMDIEISRWGEPEDNNAQFVIQPWIVPANTVRFAAPAGTVTYSMTWEPGRVAFKAVRGGGGRPAAEHVFTSGVPAAGNERIRINFYAYDISRNPIQHDAEVILERFEYLP